MHRSARHLALLAGLLCFWPANDGFAEDNKNQDCRYDFARRQMVCDAEKPALPANPPPDADAPASQGAGQYDGRDLTFYPSYSPTQAPELPDDGVDGGLRELRVRGVAADDFLNLREAPSSASPILESLPPNARGLRLVRCVSNGWCLVKYQGQSGYVSKAFVEPVADVGGRGVVRSDGLPQLRVINVAFGDTLNVRLGPSQTSAVVGVLPANARGIVMRDVCQPEWCPISYRGVTGWAGRYYLAQD